MASVSLWLHLDGVLRRARWGGGVKPYSDYDPFAWFYNRYWGHAFTEPMLPVVERLVLGKLPRRARVLDLCCGTGQLAEKLVDRGFRVTGVDGSRAMLDYARRNAPAAKFVQADARALRLPPVYHAAVSIFDSLNHVLDLDSLRAVFRNVRRALRPGGMFLFDVNSLQTFRGRREQTTSIVQPDHACLVRRFFSRERRLTRWSVTMFRLRRQVWWRNDVTIWEKCYLMREVRAALAAARFEQVRMYEGEKDLGLEGNPGRRVFLAS